jgi:hypothetical protein
MHVHAHKYPGKPDIGLIWTTFGKLALENMYLGCVTALHMYGDPALPLPSHTSHRVRTVLMLSIRQSFATSLSSLFDCAASYDNFCSTYLTRTGTWKEETTAVYMRPALNPIRSPPTYWAIEGGAPAWSNAHTDSGGTPVVFSVVRGLKVVFWGPRLSIEES